MDRPHRLLKNLGCFFVEIIVFSQVPYVYLYEEFSSHAYFYEYVRVGKMSEFYLVTNHWSELNVGFHFFKHLPTLLSFL